MRQIAKGLDGASRLCRWARVRSLRAGRATQLSRPNSADEWTDLYPHSDKVVTSLNSVVAKTVADLTTKGDVLLEAGCGSGSLSAELATVGRVIELCDFSQPILDRAVKLFEASNLQVLSTRLADLTEPLPWDDNAVDTVWSSGVLEHWTDEELTPIVSEMARVSSKSLISLVPNARSVFYRLGKHLSEEAGLWPYGRELPRSSLQKKFEDAGLVNIREFTIWPEVVTDFLRPSDPQIGELASSWWRSLPADDPALTEQGYLLVTIGYKRPGQRFG